MSWRILLIPHANKKYTQLAVSEAVNKIRKDYYNNMVVFSTWHNIPDEHSWEWSKEALQETHLRDLTHNAKVYYVTDKEKENLKLIMFNVLALSPKTLVVCNTDLGHYGPMYRSAIKKKEKEEENIIGMLLRKHEPFRSDLPCGMNVLEILYENLELFNYRGEQVKYYDSRVYHNNQNFVSYVSMVFGPTPIDDVNFSIENFSKRIPFNESTNRIFLGLLEWDTGNTCACVGDLSDTKKVGKKIKDLYNRRLYRDLGRFGCGIDTEKYLYVCILEKKEKWIEKTLDEIPLDFPSNIRGIYWGVMCEWKGDVSSIFIPSVWRDNPDWSVTDVLMALGNKAGKTIDDCEKVYFFREKGTFT